MKKALHLILAALLMNACTLAELVSPELYPEGETENLCYVTEPVLYGNVVDSETKTVLNFPYVSFVTGDVISVNGKAYTASVNSSETRFDHTDESQLAVIDGYLNAYYPQMLWNGGNPALPDTYTCEFLPDGTPKFNMPLAARATYVQNTQITLDFFHFTAFIGITINSADGFSEVNSISIATDQQIQGKFTLDYSNKSFSFVDDPEQTISDFVTLTTASTAITAEGKSFYLPLPVGTYNRLLVRVRGKDSNAKAKTAYMITVDGKPGTVAIKTRYLLDFKNNFSAAGIPVMGEGNYSEETEEADKDYRY